MRSGILGILGLALIPIIGFSIISVVAYEAGSISWRPPVLWTDQFGAYGSNVKNWVSEVANNGTALFVAGFYGNGGGQTPPPDQGLFVRAYGRHHERLWQQKFGDASRDSIYDIASGAAGLFVTGRVNNTGFLRKYDFTGNPQWTNQFAESTDKAAISIANSRVYVLGLFLSPHMGNIISLQSLDLNGGLAWTRILGNFTNGQISGVYSDPIGIYVAGLMPATNVPPPVGAFVRKYDFNGNVSWTRQFEVSSVDPTGLSGDSSGIYVTGNTLQSLTGRGGPGDMFIRKYDSNGNVLWTVESSQPNVSSFNIGRITVHSSDVYLTFTTTSNPGPYVMKYDQNGNRVWSIETDVDSATDANGLPIAIGDGTVDIGGSLIHDRYQAYVVEYAQSSSLVFFGINPPLSFVIVSGLGGVIVLSLILLRRRWTNRIHPPSTNIKRFGSKK